MFGRSGYRFYQGGKKSSWRAAFQGARFFASSGASKRRFFRPALVLGSGATLAAGAVGYWALAEDKKPNYDKIRKEIAALIKEDENRAPTMVRLAWHASGTYSKLDKTGGSDGGTIRHHPESGYGANNGLDKARTWLEKVKKSNPEITYADLYTLAGVVAIEEMDGPKIAWRPGRKDADASKCTPDGRLPDADKGEVKSTAQHVRDIFYRMGFNDREIVALLGAHAVGRCHKENSGYEGPWTRMPTTFTNSFYVDLLETKWEKKKWRGPLQYADPRDEIMMLPADMVLIQDPEFKKYVELYAKDQDLWFKDFAKAFQKLEELGVNEFNKSWWSSIFG